MPVFVWMFLVLYREKYTLEQDIREAEEAIRHKSAEVQVRTACFFQLVATGCGLNIKLRHSVLDVRLFYSATAHFFMVIFFMYFFKIGLEQYFYRLSRGLLKSFFEHWLHSYSFSVQFLTIFRGIFIFICSDT